MKTRLSGIVSLCAAAGLLASAGAWVLLRDRPAKEAGAAAVVSPPLAATRPAKDDAVRNGIGVRGHWTIEVRNPDGGLARREEFDNALENQGSILVNLLTGYRHLASWQIMITAPALARGALSMIEPDATHPIGTVNVFDNATTSSSDTYSLVVTRFDTSDVPSVPTVRLSGTAVAIESASFSHVYSSLSLCKDASCPAGQTTGGPLSKHVMPQPLPIVKGQQLLITVEFTFQPV